MEGCTFKPEIDMKSEIMMTQRIARLRITGSLYDHLYEDAQRRRERQLEYTRILPPGVTFQPDIGAEHWRPGNDDTREDFVNRLAYSKSASEKLISMRGQQQENSCLQESQPASEFHPQICRGPLMERNKGGLPIGKFLYEQFREKAMQSQAQLEEERVASKLLAPKVDGESQKIFEECKRRSYRALFEALTANEPRQKLCFSTLTLEGLADELVEFLRPMIHFLQETQTALEFEAFCAALDYQRQHSAAPTAHLFVHKVSSRATERQDVSDLFVPRTDPKSNRIASRHRPRSSVPLHDQLLREKEVWDSKLHEKRDSEEARQLRECTFHPTRLTRSRSAGSGTSRGSARSPRGISCPPTAAGALAVNYADVPAPYWMHSSESRDSTARGAPLPHLPASNWPEVDALVGGTFAEDDINQAAEVIGWCKEVVARAQDTRAEVEST